MAFFEAKPIREITGDDIRKLVVSGVQEHLFLEYKGDLYGNDDRSRREFLLDICMFANAHGGHLLIGIPELRAPDGQPTGVPDAGGMLGVDLENPEATLLSYDARVLEAIDERLPMESVAVAMGNGRHTLVFRIPDSLIKPHRVRYQKHVYFPSRRERQRYEMDVREIKELSMRAATQIEKAEALIRDVTQQPGAIRNTPVLLMSIIPVFCRDFMLDLRKPSLVRAIASFDMYDLENPTRRAACYSFNGLQRSLEQRDETVTLSSNGMLAVRTEVANIAVNLPRQVSIYPSAIDVLLRGFFTKAQEVYGAAEITSPMLLSIALHSSASIVALYGDSDPVLFDRRTYLYPPLYIAHIQEPVERTILPLCDHVHQGFGRASSPCFTADGSWIDPRQGGQHRNVWT
jgi:hypothetical protein